MAMPEAAMDKDGCPARRENNVWRPRQILPVQSKEVAQTVEKRAYGELGAGVLALDGLHQAASGRWFRPVHDEPCSGGLARRKLPCVGEVCDLAAGDEGIDGAQRLCLRERCPFDQRLPSEQAPLQRAAYALDVGDGGSDNNQPECDSKPFRKQYQKQGNQSNRTQTKEEKISFVSSLLVRECTIFFNC